MDDHELDNEACWCGVPLQCDDDLQDALRGWHHQPDPIPLPVSGCLRQQAGLTGHLPRQAASRRVCSLVSSSWGAHLRANRLLRLKSHLMARRHLTRPPKGLGATRGTSEEIGSPRMQVSPQARTGLGFTSSINN